MSTKTLAARFIAAATIGLVCGPISISAQGTEPIANAGRLTCTVEALPEGIKSAERDVSCRFQPLTGAPASYSGEIKRTSGPALVDANLVLAWTVVAPTPDIAPKSLSGRYLSSLTAAKSPSAAKVGGLRRSSETPIELRALTVSRGGDRGGQPVDPQTIVLELELRAAKA